LTAKVNWALNPFSNVPWFVSSLELLITVRENDEKKRTLNIRPVGILFVFFLVKIKISQELCPRRALVLSLCNGNNWLSTCLNRKKRRKRSYLKKKNSKPDLGWKRQKNMYASVTYLRKTHSLARRPFINQKRRANFKSPSAAFWQCNKSACPLVYKKSFNARDNRQKKKSLEIHRTRPQPPPPPLVRVKWLLATPDKAHLTYYYTRPHVCIQITFMYNDVYSVFS